MSLPPSRCSPAPEWGLGNWHVTWVLSHSHPRSTWSAQLSVAVLHPHGLPESVCTCRCSLPTSHTPQHPTPPRPSYKQLLPLVNTSCELTLTFSWVYPLRIAWALQQILCPRFDSSHCSPLWFPDPCLGHCPWTPCTLWLTIVTHLSSPSQIFASPKQSKVSTKFFPIYCTKYPTTPFPHGPQAVLQNPQSCCPELCRAGRRRKGDPGRGQWVPQSCFNECTSTDCIYNFQVWFLPGKKFYVWTT